MLCLSQIVESLNAFASLVGNLFMFKPVSCHCSILACFQQKVKEQLLLKLGTSSKYDQHLHFVILSTDQNKLLFSSLHPDLFVCRHMWDYVCAWMWYRFIYACTHVGLDVHTYKHKWKKNDIKWAVLLLSAYWLQIRSLTESEAGLESKSQRVFLSLPCVPTQVACRPSGYHTHILKWVLETGAQVF